MFKKFIKFDKDTDSIFIDVYSIIAIEDFASGNGKPVVEIHTDCKKSFYVEGKKEDILKKIEYELKD